jgi:hypothetical protein
VFGQEMAAARAAGPRGRGGGSMSDLIGWTVALGLVVALWGAMFWFGADTRDGRDWQRRGRD